MNIHDTRGSFQRFLAETFTVENAQRIDKAIATTNQPLDVVVVELGVMQEEKLGIALASFFDVEFVQSPERLVDDEMVERLGVGFLSQHKVLPVKGANADQFTICLADPFNEEIVQLVSYAIGETLSICIATRASIDNAIIALSEKPTDPAIDSLDDSFELSLSDIDRLKTVAEEAPVVRLISRLIQTAVDAGATDIHIEPMALHVQIRLRVDGTLIPFENAALNLLPGIVTRIKILSKLNISERRLPQDGRMRMGVRGVDIDFRVSVVPSVHGETLVLRVLDRSRIQLDLKALGFETAARDELKQLADLANGLVLITGPTGSGKTTSLYALLNLIDFTHLKVFTVEDPVEYPMDGVTQLQVNPEIGLTFAAALRSVLRQDPDVILVGEIRDKETAELAMQAALTGHLVLSTLHTNSAVGAVTRLRDMGIDDYLISATLKASVGQRLLRKTCLVCASDTLQGCSECNGSGFKGRTVTHEILQISKELGTFINQGKSEDYINDAALETGYTSMSKHASLLVEKGVTTREELLCVLHLGN